MIDWVYINKHRCTKPERTVPPQFCSTEIDGFNGMFRFSIDGKTVRCMISDGGGWKHVSVSIEYDKRPPTWAMMCRIKDIFWDAEDCVIQYHPKKSEYVNMAENCLHLWQPFKDGRSQPFPTPPSIFVGIK